MLARTRVHLKLRSSEVEADVLAPKTPATSLLAPMTPAPMTPATLARTASGLVDDMGMV
jgi:hypothetical protein